MNHAKRSPVRSRRQFLAATFEAAAASSLGVLTTRGADPPNNTDAGTPHAATQPAARSDEKWWVQRQERINRRLSRGNVDAVIIGDSITEGWEHHHGLAVWDAFYGHRRIINLGFGGDQTQHVLWRLDHSDFSNISPKAAFVMIGTNNLGAGHPVPQIVDGILAIVERLRHKLPKVRIIMHGILCRGPKPDDAGRQQAVAVNQALAKLAAPRGFEMLDPAGSFLNPDGTAKAERMSTDFLHLSATGYQAWAEAIEGTLAGILGDQPGRIPPVCPEDQDAAQAITALGGIVLTDREGRVTTVDPGRNPKAGGEIWRTIGALRHLKVLACDRCRLGDEDVQTFAGLTELKYLNLRDTLLTDDGLRHLSKLKNLTWLAIGAPGVTGHGVAHIKHLSHLRLLTFWNSALTDAACEHLREMKSLQELFLGGTRVTREAIGKLTHDLPGCAVIA